MVKPIIQRIDIWFVQLDPTRGSEIKKTRPYIVILPNEMSPLKTAIIAPMTSKGFFILVVFPVLSKVKKDWFY